MATKEKATPIPARDSAEWHADRLVRLYSGNREAAARHARGIAGDPKFWGKVAQIIAGAQSPERRAHSEEEE